MSDTVANRAASNGICWVMIEDGAVGMLSQALGLAEALGFDNAHTKTVKMRWPWTWAPTVPHVATFAAMAPGMDVPQPPWPDLIIACGRHSALFSLHIKRLSKGRTKLVYVQHPKTARKYFDVIVAPRHDRLTGPNVVVSHGALHRVTDAKLKSGAAAIADKVASLRQPRVAVLVGGTNHSYRMDADWAAQFCADLRSLMQNDGCSLMITTSRRTDAPVVRALESAFRGKPEVLLWTGEGDGPNPYFGYLGSADVVISTCESISMVSEACATGKPVMMARLPGSSSRFERFLNAMLEDGSVRWFHGRLEHWENTGRNEMPGIAAEVRKRLRLS